MSYIKKLLLFTAFILTISVFYFIYAYTQFPPLPERETLLEETGEALGEAGLWLLIFIYGRTLMKILLGKGSIARRLLPDYSSPVSLPVLNQLLAWLNRTHVYFGITAVVVILMHIILMGLPMHILFFPAVLGLVLWQAVFGIFLTWRYSPKELKQFSYLVHAQFISGIMIGVFAYFGHLLIDD
jgi:hypothetical protein